MNTTQGIPLAEFFLDERTYARSKLWSNMLNEFSRLEESEELPIDEIDRHWKCEDDPSENDDEESDSDDSLNKSVEIETDEDEYENERPAFDRSVLQIRNISKSLAKQRYKLTKNIPATIIEEENDINLDDFLNETIPIIKEHERKWQESGMLRVMNTFDEKKIEEKVGNWLRNKSVCCGNGYRTIGGQSMQPVYEHHMPRLNYDQNPDSEDESMHSMDTARYVLSNRKPRNSSNSTTIKTFRLVKSKRDALREKYAFPEAEFEVERSSQHRKHRNALHGKQLFDAKCVRSTPISFRSNIDLKLSQESHCIRRKHKVLNKRREPRHHSSSSEDDEDISNFCPYARRKRSLSTCISPSTSSPRSVPKISKRVLQSMPRKRESECQCCNSRRLCDATMHLADTSTEEWVVMNYTPSKTPCRKNKLMEKKKQNTDILENVEEVEKTKLKTKKIQKMSKNKNDKKKLLSKKKEPLDDTFERDTKLAIKLSKKLHASDVKKHKKMSASKGKNEKKIKTNNSAAQNKEIIDENTDLKIDANGISNDDPREENMPVNSGVVIVTEELSDNKEKNRLSQSMKDINTRESRELKDSPKLDSSIEKNIKPRPKSHKLKKLEKLRRKILQPNHENTIFSGNICNSTAITNNEIAVSKQLSSGCKTLSRNNRNMSALETTPQCSSANTAETPDPDCTVVSSTTGDPKLNYLGTPLNKKSNKGILIYTPLNRNLVPPESVSNGVFNITEEHLRSVIGEKAAHKFWKYYVGRKRFADNLTIYFRPPSHNVDIEKETDSEDDELQLVGRYGDLHACLEK